MVVRLLGSPFTLAPALDRLARTAVLSVHHSFRSTSSSAFGFRRDGSGVIDAQHAVCPLHQTAEAGDFGFKQSIGRAVVGGVPACTGPPPSSLSPSGHLSRSTQQTRYLIRFSEAQPVLARRQANDRWQIRFALPEGQP